METVMRWMKTTAAVFLVGLGSAKLSLADPFDAKQVPADAKWVIHVDMDAARPTKIWDALYTRLINDDNFQEKVGQIEQVTNMHFPADVHDITLYGRAVGEQAGVVVLHARMDRGQTLSILQMNASYDEKDYGDYKIVAWEDNGKKLYAAFHDDSTIIVGRSAENIQAALDVMDGKTESIKDGPLTAGAKPQLLAYVAVKDVAQLKKQDEPQSPIIRQIQNGWISLSEKDGSADVQANLTTDNADTAEQLHAAMDGIKAMVTLAGTGENADPKAQMAAKALKSFHATAADKSVSVDWSIPLDQVSDFIAKLPVNGQPAKP
jgi:hypothetical protein